MCAPTIPVLPNSLLTLPAYVNQLIGQHSYVHVATILIMVHFPKTTLRPKLAMTTQSKPNEAYLAFMKLARPLQVTLLCILSGGVLITPLLVIHFLFCSNLVMKHIFAWSFWLMVVWVAGHLMYVVVDVFG